MACSSASICYPGTSATGGGGNNRSFLTGSGPAGVLISGRRLGVSTQLRCRRSIVRSDLDSNVSDMRNNGKSHFALLGIQFVGFLFP